MNETPEAVRDRIKAEELAKGSDPRVAEGRSKAAEMRARMGLPIDPQEAWKARLAQEGGAPAAPASEAGAQAPRTDTGPTHVPPESSGPGESPSPPASAAPSPPASAAPSAPPEPAAPAEGAAAQAPRTDTGPAQVAEDISGPGESPEQSAPSAPSTEPVTEAPVPAAPTEPAAPEPVFEPEIGDVVEVEDEVVFEVGGIKVRDSRIATWILVLLLAIPLWAMLYLLGLGGGDVGQATTGCVVDADRSFVCFQPKHENGGGGGGH